MTCAYCGTELPEGAMFCGECGRAVAGRAAKTATKSAKEPVSVPSTASALASTVSSVRSPRKRTAAPVVEAEPPVAEPESIAELEPMPELEPVVEVVEPDVEPEPVPEPQPVVVVPVAPGSAAEPARTETCVQCGAVLEASDIFCPECGFVRQSVTARSRPSDTAVLDPFPWGLPRSTESPATIATPTLADETDVDADIVADIDIADNDAGDIDETRIIDHTPRGERFVLQFSTGESVSVSGTGLVGRNPIPEPGEYFDSIVTILDPGKSVSKTHLEFGQDGGIFWISDRFSGNGTVLREPERDPRRCDAGKRYRVTRGARVDIGEQFFIVS